MKIRKITIVAIVLGILILISLMQAVQLNNLKEKLSEEGGVKISSSSGSSSGIIGKTTSPVSKGNLPQMVGGC